MKESKLYAYKKGRDALLCIEIQHIAAAGIDNKRFSPLALSFEIEAIALVNMSVCHDTRTVFIDQLEKCFKASVRQIGIIPQAECG